MIFKTLYKNYFGANVGQHIKQHREAEAWAKEHGIKIRYGDAYVFANVFEFEREEDVLVFTLMFGELME